MGKGKKGGKGRRRGDSSSEDESDKEAATTNTNTKLTFAERRQQQRQHAADKRRAKLKCHLCGQEGHARRECPGLEDDGQGESKYKNAKGDAGAQMKTASTSTKEAKFRGRKRNVKHPPKKETEGEVGLGGHHNGMQVELPPGFGSGAPIIAGSKDADVDAEEKPAYYYDASCDVDAIVEYLRSGRSSGSKSKKLSAQEAIKEYEQGLLAAQVNNTTDTDQLLFGGCLSRSTLPSNTISVDRPWIPSQHEQEIAKLHPVWHLIGLDHNNHHQEGFADMDMDAAAQALVETIHKANTKTIHNIVGLFADLDYPEKKKHNTKDANTNRLDRHTQLRHLRATLLAAAHSSNRTVQIRVSPGAPTKSTTLDEHCPYNQVTKDLMELLNEFLPQHPNLKIHLSCWKGSPQHMNQLLQRFPNQVYFGINATVTFAKAKLLHECVFDLLLKTNPTDSRWILETGRPGTIPSALNRTLGRDAYGHPAWSIPWIAHSIMAQQPGGDATDRDATAASIARQASANTILLYPGILQADVNVEDVDVEEDK